MSNLPLINPLEPDSYEDLGPLKFEADDFRPLMEWSNRNFAIWANEVLRKRLKQFSDLAAKDFFQK